MGILSKALIAGAGYYAYKHHQDKKKAQRGEVDFNNQQRDLNAPGAANDYYRDNKSQYSDNGYPRDSKRELDYQPQGNPSYANFDRKSEYAAGAKY